VTIILALRQTQLGGYDNNPLTLARTAMLLGYLRLSANVPQHLPDVQLPAEPPFAAVARASLPAGHDALLTRSLESLALGERVALIADATASGMLETLLEKTASSKRLQLSFTTGLNPSPARPFRIHLLPAVDSRTHRQLTALGIRFVAATV